MEGGETIGVSSPIFQMKRHESLLKSILPNIPIYSILCFSNDSVIIDGREFSREYPIVYVEQLGEYLSSIQANEVLNEESMRNIVDIIEKYKVCRMENK